MIKHYQNGYILCWFYSFGIVFNSIFIQHFLLTYHHPRFSNPLSIMLTNSILPNKKYIVKSKHISDSLNPKINYYFKMKHDDNYNITFSYYPIQTWFELLATTQPIPCSFANSMAKSVQKLPTTAPSKLAPSTQAVPPFCLSTFGTPNNKQLCFDLHFFFY